MKAEPEGAGATREALIVDGQVGVAKVGVGRLDRGDPSELQLLHQTVLQRLERPCPKRPLAWGE